MQFLEEDISDYTTEVCGSFLGIEANTTNEPFTLTENEYLTGHVTISGEWNGIIAVNCSRHIIRIMADNLFGHTGNVSSEDEIDSLKEMTNIIGGNLKAHLPQPCTLGIPTVFSPEDRNSLLDMDLLTQINFHSCDSQFRVTMYKGK